MRVIDCNSKSVTLKLSRADAEYLLHAGRQKADRDAGLMPGLALGDEGLNAFAKDCETCSHTIANQ